jgi:hypothetical protein
MRAAKQAAMRFQARIPRFLASTVDAGPEPSRPVLDGSEVLIANRWQLPPGSVAIVGRPAVWVGLDVKTPAIPLGFTTLPPRRLRWEQDFGGHLYLAVTSADAAHVAIVEAGPLYPGGTGNLVPFAYPEDDFAERGVVDFAPIVVPPPLGLSAEFFANLVRATQRDYDGDQRYRAIEMPFLRVGRDSNSYAVGVLLACGVDPRAIPKPQKEMRWELIGYPGAEDPVHRANFGAYLGAPTDLGEGVIDVAYHNADGSVRLAVVGGPPGGKARLPDGTVVTLDPLGRIAFSPEDAHAHGLPSTHTEPPTQIRDRRFFPRDPQPQGAQITLVVGGKSAPLQPGAAYRGTIVARHDALGLATLREPGGRDIVLPLTELGVELRDPKRVDDLLRVGTELTVGLHSDRHPKLVAHGADSFRDRFKWHRPHLPRPINVAGGLTLAAVALAFAAFWWRERAD